MKVGLAGQGSQVDCGALEAFPTSGALRIKQVGKSTKGDARRSRVVSGRYKRPDDIYYSYIYILRRQLRPVDLGHV